MKHYDKHEFIERVAKGLRSIIEEPVAFVINDDLVDWVYDEPSILNIRVFHGSFNMQIDTDCPIIPLFKEEDNMIGLYTKYFCEGFDDYETR